MIDVAVLKSKWPEFSNFPSDPLRVGDAVPFGGVWEVIVDQTTICRLRTDGSPPQYIPMSQAFIKSLGGSGWGGTRRANRQKIEVKGSQNIRVGDILLGYDRSPDLWEPGCFITGIDTSLRCHGRRLTAVGVLDSTYTVLRADYEMTGPFTTKPDPGRFPHHCPSCGKRAYVGLLRVEHEDPKVSCLG